jgi:hypothetical protein
MDYHPQAPSSGGYDKEFFEILFFGEISISIYTYPPISIKR